MRKLVVTNVVSLDGYCAGPGGNPMALPMDGFFDDHSAERLRAADTLLLGRGTYEMFSGFWPAVADDEGASPTNREISRLNGAVAKVVVSDSLTDLDGPWAATTTIVRRADAHAAVAELKEGDGGDVLVFGSHVLWNDLLAAGLVDELHLMIGPTALGDGVPAFTGGTPSAFRLRGVRTAEGSDNVLMSYEMGV